MIDGRDCGMFAELRRGGTATFSLRMAKSIFLRGQGLVSKDKFLTLDSVSWILSAVSASWNERGVVSRRSTE